MPVTINEVSASERSTTSLRPASKDNPCPHCGHFPERGSKDDWCYSIGSLSVCKRQAEPAPGWYRTTKSDAEGTPYYAPVIEKKATRREQIRYWPYQARDGSNLVRVRRVDTLVGKAIRQQRWDGGEWKFGLKGYVKREDIPICRLPKTSVRRYILSNYFILCFLFLAWREVRFPLSPFFVQNFLGSLAASFIIHQE